MKHSLVCILWLLILHTRVVQKKKTVVGDWHFDNLNRNYLQSQKKSVCARVDGVINLVHWKLLVSLADEGIGCKTCVTFVVSHCFFKIILLTYKRHLHIITYLDITLPRVSGHWLLSIKILLLVKSVKGPFIVSQIKLVCWRAIGWFRLDRG